MLCCQAKFGRHWNPLVRSTRSDEPEPGQPGWLALLDHVTSRPGYRRRYAHNTTANCIPSQEVNLVGFQRPVWSRDRVDTHPSSTDVTSHNVDTKRFAAFATAMVSVAIGFVSMCLLWKHYGFSSIVDPEVLRQQNVPTLFINRFLCHAGFSQVRCTCESLLGSVYPRAHGQSRI